MSAKDGSPAFPALNYIVPSDLEARHVRRLGETQGMSLRDWFAGQALALGGEFFHYIDNHRDNEAEHVASVAYAIADAMLDERERQS